jgi:hypothetical protein
MSNVQVLYQLAITYKKVQDTFADLDGDVQFVFGFANRGTNDNPIWLTVRLFASRDETSV